MKLTGKHVDNSSEVAMDLKLKWIYCNVYPLTVNAVKKRIDCIFDKYLYLMKMSNNKKKETYCNQYFVFINNQTSIRDTIADPKFIQIQQEQWGVTMTDKEKMFYENQKKNPPMERSESFADRQWEIANQRRQKRKECSRNESYGDKSFGWESEKEIQMVIGDDLMYEDNDKDEDQDFTAMKETDQKKRYVFVDEVDDLEDDSPYKYRHTQTGPRSIRPEYYTVKSILQPEYHMSDHQSDGAIIVVANHLFG